MNGLKMELRHIQIPRLDRPEKFYDHLPTIGNCLLDSKQDSQHLAENLLVPLLDRFGRYQPRVRR